MQQCPSCKRFFGIREQVYVFNAGWQEKWTEVEYCPFCGKQLIVLAEGVEHKASVAPNPHQEARRC